MFFGGIEKDGGTKSVVPETMIVLSVVLLLLLGQFKLCFMVLSTVTLKFRCVKVFFNIRWMHIFCSCSPNKFYNHFLVFIERSQLLSSLIFKSTLITMASSLFENELCSSVRFFSLDVFVEDLLLQYYRGR